MIPKAVSRTRQSHTEAELLQERTGTERADTMRGGSGDDILHGLGGNDIFDGRVGADTYHGGFGNDVFYIMHPGDNAVEAAGEGRDRAYAWLDHSLEAHVEQLFLYEDARTGTGNDGDNLLVASPNGDLPLDATLSGLGGDDRLQGDRGDDRLHGGDGRDRLWGGAGADMLDGGDGADRLYGGGGVDTLDGGDGRDRLTGGRGFDSLWGGGGADVFAFEEGDTAAARAGADLILDFGAGGRDRVDLAAIDAVAGTQQADDAFSFIGAAAFSGDGTGGELRYEVAGGLTLVSGDVDGDGAADFLIRLDGAHPLAAGDFVL